MCELKLFCAWLLVCAAVLPIQCRYVYNMYEPEQDSEIQQRSDDDDYDVDLEDTLIDYYEDLREAVDKVWKALQGKPEGSREETRPDYDYQSDMAPPEPDADDKKPIYENSGSVDENGYFFNTSSSVPEDFHNSSIKVGRESNQDEVAVQRSKELRLHAIISQILSLRGNGSDSDLNETVFNSQHFETLREMYEKNAKRLPELTPSNMYTEKVQSFYPSCDVPRNTDEDLWTDQNHMNLLFELKYPSTLDGMTINIVAAKLRLYKLSQGNVTMPSAEPSSSSLKLKTDKPILFNGFGSMIPVGEDDRQIRVSVYWYTRSLRRNRVKRKLLDSRMFSVYGEKWAEFNIRSAVRTWKESGKNFGLVVTVEDEDGSLLPAEQYLHAMNCSKWTATVRPIPSILLDAANQYFSERSSAERNDSKIENGTESDEDKSKTFPYQPLHYPIIDLRTIEVPESEIKNIALYQNAKNDVDSHMMRLSNRKNDFEVQNSNYTVFVIKNDGSHGRNSSFRPERKRSEDSGAAKTTFFQNVALGSPSAGQNRNVLVPIITKSDLDLTDESDPKYHKKEFMKMQNDEPQPVVERTTPRIRHNNRRAWENFQKHVRNETRVFSQ